MILKIIKTLISDLKKDKDLRKILIFCFCSMILSWYLIFSVYEYVRM